MSVLFPAIVYEDANFLVCNKPAGLISHPTHAGSRDESVVSWLLKKYPEIQGVGEDPLRPGIVHRLDKDTSGLMVIAKNNTAFAYLKNLFQEHKIKKTYLALVHGKLKEKNGVIDAPLGKIGAKQTTRIHGTRDLKERSAVTEYRVIKSYTLRDLSYTLLEVMPQTGRTHQIRIHLKSIGHPIVGDILYGPKKSSRSSSASSPRSFRDVPRLFLHAQKLSFVSSSGQALAFEADLPPELEQFLKSLASPSHL